MPNYIEIIGSCFPSAEATVVVNGDPTSYVDIEWITNPIPQATLEAGDCTLSPTVDLVSLESGEGTIIPIVFNYESTAKNKWLSHEGDNSLSSDEIPAIVPFDCKLVGVTFSNSVSSVETDVQIYHTPKNSTTRSMIEMWPIRNSRTGHKTDVTEDLLLAGSKLSVYLKDRGTNVRKVVVVLYLQVLRLLQEENTENFSSSDDDDDH